jgi:alkylated DNA repair dioxygenase AlkB
MSAQTHDGHGVTWQPSLLAVADAPDVDLSLDGARRRSLGQGAWVDHVPGWVQGPDVLFDQILTDAPWGAEEQRPMYDRIVDVPRLTTRGWHEGRPRLLDRMARCLGRHYGVRLPAISANLYRDGNDSVAWHGDRIGRSREQDTMVAILSVGAPRDLVLRPRGGGSSIRVPAGHGDLVVMGGSCQRTWDHCVPKTTKPVGPRISVQFRTRGVR